MPQASGLGNDIVCKDCKDIPFINEKVCRAWIDIPFYGTTEERMAYADSFKPRVSYKPKDCVELLAPRTRQRNATGGYVFPQEAVKKIPCPSHLP